MGFFGAAYGLWRGRLKILYIILLTCIESLKVFLINTNTILMMLAKLAPPGLRKTVFFLMGFFLSRTLGFRGQQGKGEVISLTPLYPFHPLQRRLDISRAITAESSPLHIASCRTRTGNRWFPSTIRLMSQFLCMT